MGSVQEKKYTTKNVDCLIIRDAVENDAAGIIEINKEVISETFFMLREPDEGNYTLENTRSDIKNHLNNDSALYIVAEIDSVLTGFLEFQNGGLRRTSHAGIFSILIKKNYRQDGIGAALLQTLIDWAESNPRIEKVTLAVFSTNERAIGLYKKFGFVEEGRCPKDMKLNDGSYIDSVLMYKFV